jgi:tape measure domain-containing protein
MPLTGVEVANAYLALRVKMPGVQADIHNALRGVDTDGPGQQMGSATGKGFTKGFAAVAGAVGGIAAQLAGTALSAIGSIVAEARSASDAGQKFANTLSFAGIDTSKIKELAKSTRAYADVTVYDLETIQNTTAKLAANGVKDYDKIVEAAGNLNAVAGGNAETFKSVGLVLAQSSGAGRLMTQDWNQLANAIPGASGVIQKALLEAGAYTGNFRKAMEEGQITSEEFNAALLQLGNEPVAVEAAKSTETLEGSLGNLKATIVGVLSDVITTAKPTLTGFINGLADAFKTGIAIIGEVSNFVRDNMAWIGPLAVGIGVIVGAMTAWRLANMAWLAIQSVVSAVTAVHTALTYGAAGASYAFNTATKAGAIAQWALNAAMSANPIGVVIVAIAALVAGLVWFFTQTELGREVWANVTTAIATAATWLWETVLRPVFEGIGAVFKWLWENIILPIGTLIVNYYRFWGAVAFWLWENVIQPVFAKIGEIFNWIWTSIIQPIVGFIVQGVEWLGLVFLYLYERHVKPVWEGIAKVIGDAWAWIDTYVFAPFKTGIDLVRQGFEIAASGIATAWDGIKRAAAVPINFVLETVWNNGLRSFWNDMVTELGLTDMKLPRAQTIRFAKGGVLPGYTPGRDVHRFWSPTAGVLEMSGGEGIIRPDVVKAHGGAAWVDALNSGAGTGGSIGEWFGDVWENVRNAAAVAWDFLSDPGGAIQKHVIQGIIQPLMGGQNIFGQTVGGLAIKTVRGFTDLLKQAAPQISGGAGMGWERMWQIVKGRFPWASLNSAYRPGDPLYHGKGRAIDTTASMDIFNFLRSAFPNSSELIYSPAGGNQLQNGRPYFWHEPVRSAHWDHVHWAMKHGGVWPGLYDEGGWLPHGGVGVNLSGEPERILSPDESRAYERGGKPPVEVHFHNPVVRDLMADAWDAAQVVGTVSQK